MLATDLLADLFFMADVVLNFNTGFIKDQVQLGSSAAQLCLLCVLLSHTLLSMSALRCRVLLLCVPFLSCPLRSCQLAERCHRAWAGAGHGAPPCGNPLPEDMVCP